MKKYDYDIIVIGGGAAGFVSSKLAHVRSVVQQVYDGHRQEAFQKLGIDDLFGAPTFTDVVKQAAKLCYIERLQNNPVLKFLRKIL